MQLIGRLKRIARNEWLHHILFWVFAYIILLSMFSTSSSINRIDHIYTAIFLFTLILATEINLLVLIPKFLYKKKFKLYIISLITILFVFSAFNQLLFNNLIDYILPGYYFISYYSLFDILKFFIVFAGITTLLQLSTEWFYLIEARQNLIQAQKDKVDAELKALRNQLNPHFLFNSLNVIYSLSLNNSPETSRVLLQLSDILRYILYDANVEFVTLKDEVSLIENYLDIQRYRVNRNTEIRLETQISDESARIAPMLLLPLVENCFKHGVRKEIKNTFVLIILKSDENAINFMIENSKPQKVSDENQDRGGIGLDNIRNRLRLLYPDLHKFEVYEGERLFRVKIELFDLKREE
ncbi:MAG: sensor histidine kinase [Bacteroidales bacterium]